MAYLIPQAGVTVKYPDGRRKLPADGAEVALDTYWHRRLRDGDVKVGEPPDAKPASAKATTRIEK